MKPIKLRCERSICFKKDLKFVLLISKKTFPFYLFENQVRTRRIIRLTSKEILSPNLIFSVSGFAVTFNYTYKLFNFHHSPCRTAIKWKPRRLQVDPSDSMFVFSPQSHCLEFTRSKYFIFDWCISIWQYFWWKFIHDDTLWWLL